MKVIFVLVYFYLQVLGVLMASEQPLPALTSSSSGQSNATSESRDDVSTETALHNMVDSWPKGGVTNGLCCAIQVIQNSGLDNRTICDVNVINWTSNTVRACLYLPPEATLQLDLLDHDGHSVEKTAAGKLFHTCTEEEINDWFRQIVMTRQGGHYYVPPLLYAQVYSFKPADYFILEQPGQYTLRLSMEVIQNKQDATGKTYFPRTLLPKVTAKIQILATDIPQLNALPTNWTNAPAKRP